MAESECNRPPCHLRRISDSKTSLSSMPWPPTSSSSRWPPKVGALLHWCPSTSCRQWTWSSSHQSSLFSWSRHPLRRRSESIKGEDRSSSYVILAQGKWQGKRGYRRTVPRQSSAPPLYCRPCQAAESCQRSRSYPDRRRGTTVAR